MALISLLSLNDDVLFEIFSLLSGREALAVASTSKRAYRFAIYRVFASVEWTRESNENDGSSEADAFWAYMRAPEPVSQIPRVRHLRHLVLGEFALDDIPSLCAILFQAPNLRTIDLCLLEHHLDDFIPALGALHLLEKACLSCIDPRTIPALPAMFSSSKLSSLTLNFGEYYWGLPKDDVDLTALVSFLASMPNIQTLSIDIDNVLAVLPNTCRPPKSSRLSLPSVRHLSLLCEPQVLESIVPLCPNLVTLSLFLYCEDDRPVTFSIAADDRRPVVLKELKLSHVKIAEDTLRRMGHVHSLVVGGLGRSLSSSEFHDLPPLLEAVQPFALHLLTPEPALTEPERTWRPLVDAARQLRSLEVTVKGHASPANVHDYLDPLLAALQSSSLVHLTLDFPPAFQAWRTAASMAAVDGLREAEVRRVDALLALPPALARAVPSLRLLALHSCRPETTGFDNARERGERMGTRDFPPELAAELAWEDDVERLWGPTSVCVRPALRRLNELRKEVPRDERWWWIEGEGATRTPVEIWREDGERGREIVRRADFNKSIDADAQWSEVSAHVP
ncbi:uncharacterized protein BXZ73DRAFT_80276 [Epithele typhae]|uniref:uncharacterized protein n=1 Tax=Epithele typhae TaxID=378194 RepID=UPI00200849E7|nr:uncharacterized protein BXZ73DRAFT_80276 [Epithele typhae]KAH9919761.1 hypothetical protein BXZ73DRAFT_80276 [Epithele typhae]